MDAPTHIFEAHRQRLRRHLGRSAFTLVEVAISSVVLGIILVAVGSSLVVASKALPSDTSTAGSISSAGAIADRVAGEAAYALSVTELGPAAITFTVAPRGSDTGPETIRYAWAGAGAPLTRQY